MVDSDQWTPDRRHLLATLGITAAAGCLDGSGDEGDGPGTDGEDGGSGDGTGSETETDVETDAGTETDTEETGETETEESTETETETKDEADPTEYDGEYETVTHEGVEVPLVPIDDAYEWFQNDEARFADARGQAQYDRAHIAGAVFSPAPDGADDDPVEEWPTDERIVTYCGCPHHLSSMRAAALREEGYENVFALDEGYYEWSDRGYPLEGEDVDDEPELRVVEGAADPAAAGQMAMAEHAAGDQMEAAPIGDGGNYQLHLRFADVDDASPITVETPGYELEAPLGELTAGRIGPDGTIQQP